MTDKTELNLVENIMQEKELIEFEGRVVISSRVIAKLLGKRHDNVKRDLENILSKEGYSNLSNHIILHSYEIVGQNKIGLEYLLTKQGFILYMFNIQGFIDFKMNYINKYDLMESFIKGNCEIEYKEYAKKEINKLNNSLQTQIKEIENKLENQIRIDYSQQRAIQKKINHKIEIKYYDFILASSKSKRSWFMAIYKGIKDKFQVASYRDLKQKDFDECIEFINNWTPPKYLFEE